MRDYFSSWTAALILLSLRHIDAHRHLPRPADGVAVTRLASPCSGGGACSFGVRGGGGGGAIRVYWTPAADAAFTRVILAPHFDKYRIMEDFPVPGYSATFEGLQEGRYAVRVQSGDGDGAVGESGPALEFDLQSSLSVGESKT